MRVRVIGIKEYRDRHGKLRRYHRKSGMPLDLELKGTALAAEVDRLDRQFAALQPVAGTLRLLIVDYKKRSEHWRDLRTRTRKDYERVYAWLGKALDYSLASIRTPDIAALRDKARDQHGFKFANQMVVTLRVAYSFGVQYGHVKADPTAGVTTSARPADTPDANRPWEPAEAIALLKALPIHLRAPTALAAYLGIREGDVLKMSGGAVADGRLSFTSSKTRRALELPICDDLAAALAEYAAWRAKLFAKIERTDDATTLFVNSRGKPWTDDGFKTSFGKARNAAVEAKIVPTGMTFHGARHAVSTILAEEGFGEGQVKHLLGHGAETMTEHYQRRARRRPMLKSMTDRVQAVYRNAESPNVVAIGTGTDSTNPSVRSV